MPKTAYPAAIIAPLTADHAYSVLFPDLPGCFSAGSSLHDAFLAAMEALDGHLGLLMEGDDPLPAPSSLDQARAAVETDSEPGDGEIAAVLLVPATLPGRSQRFNITMDSNLVAQIDAITENRSAFLADAARTELRRRQHSAA